jgi:hypothetical protein
MAQKQPTRISLGYATRGVKVKTVTAIAIASIGLVLVAGCSSPKLPRASADPVVVTNAYLSAAKAQHCDVTKALTTDRTWAWCRNPTLTKFTVSGTSYKARPVPGAPVQTCVDTTVTSKATDQAETMNGTLGWSFCWRKVDGRWRLVNQGQG